jgi:hypothetical protein
LKWSVAEIMHTFWLRYRRQVGEKIRAGLLVGVSLMWLNFWGIIPPPNAAAAQAEHIVLVVLEGIKPSTIQSGATPHLAKLAQEGAVSWSAQSISPPLTVSAMASLLTGLPVEKHRITPDWEQYDFAILHDPSCVPPLSLIIWTLRAGQTPACSSWTNAFIN